MREIVNIYKEVAKPDSKGLTKTDFRNLLFRTDPTDRRKKDRSLQDEVCSDMFRLLDKDGDGYVMLQDLLKHFVPPQQVCGRQGLGSTLVFVVRGGGAATPC